MFKTWRFKIETIDKTERFRNFYVASVDKQNFADAYFNRIQKGRFL